MKIGEQFILSSLFIHSFTHLYLGIEKALQRWVIYSLYFFSIVGSLSLEKPIGLLSWIPKTTTVGPYYGTHTLEQWFSKSGSGTHGSPQNLFRESQIRKILIYWDLICLFNFQSVEFPRHSVVCDIITG